MYLNNCQLPILAPQNVDLYEVLALARNSSAEQVKSAYHRALLTHHPDKNASKPTTVHIAMIKEAYRILSSPSLRALYDVQLEQERSSVGPRPAQVISLEEFEEDPIDQSAWTLPCRCGAIYRITEDDMESGTHLIGCSGCSELVWVGFELAKDEESYVSFTYHG
ncbi:hypothetical protein GYMLUDRAFT_65670 [Collybiopsis luxurians FD-317 M1]|nr:hypothetical protein GYMLUDRAFT_65670 [Collybiopsis luxurians FD-317 M1]